MQKAGIPRNRSGSSVNSIAKGGSRLSTAASSNQASKTSLQRSSKAPAQYDVLGIMAMAGSVVSESSLLDGAHRYALRQQDASTGISIAGSGADPESASPKRERSRGKAQTATGVEAQNWSNWWLLEARRMREEADRMHGDCMKLRGMIDDTRSESRRLELEVVGKKKEMERWALERESAFNNISWWREDIKRRQKELEQAKQEGRDARSEVSRLAARLTELESDLEDAKLETVRVQAQLKQDAEESSERDTDDEARAGEDKQPARSAGASEAGDNAQGVEQFDRNDDRILEFGIDDDGEDYNAFF
mmetsp:Transcript_158240/g.303649  ORF Transcript_158240/g.303649 Transcript_158240/m.303649 type:complete len:306 (+) Transcript_158240:52-969(+)